MARRALLLGLVWFALTGPDPGALLPGLLAVAAGCWVSLRLLPGFFWRSLIGAADVALRALHPRMPPQPGWVELPTTLPGGGRVAPGGSFSLMPGTLVAGTRQDCLLVHCLDTTRPEEAAVRADERALAEALASSPDPTP